MDTETKMELILAEYLQLQKMIEDFDARALTIKAWCVTLSAAGVVTSYTQDAPIILFVSAATALAFWLIETLWKSNQQAFYPRIKDIENRLRNDQLEILKPLQIASSWSDAWHQNMIARALKIFWWPHVFLPHLPVALIAAGLLLVAPPSNSPPEVADLQTTVSPNN